MAADDWTRPITGSPYPLALVAEGDNPLSSSTRFLGGLMFVIAVVSYMFVVPLINAGVAYAGYLVEAPRGDWAAYSKLAQSYGTVWGVLGAHLALGSLTLVVWAYLRFMHRRKMAWMWSVSPGVRWRYALACLGVAVVVVGAVGAYQWSVGPGWNPAGDWGWYAGVILVTTPFQALAEEVLFRGYLMWLFGSILRNVWFAIGATAVIFALFHGTQNPWLFGSRLVFGVLAGILVWKTGGLEAAVAIHVVNNLVAFAIAIGTGTLTQLRTTTEVGWTQAVSDVGMFAVAALGCWAIAVRLKVPAVVRPA